MKTLLTGGAGLTGSIVATPLLTSEPTETILNVIVQVIIGIATIIGLFRKRSKNHAPDVN